MGLSSTVKESVILKALNRGAGVTLESVAKSNNIGLSTLSRWLTERRKSSITSSPNSASRAHWLTHLLNTKDMDEVSLGSYCRRHGIYSHQLTEWKNKFRCRVRFLSQAAIGTEIIFEHVISSEI
jgi:transposase-like protein